MNTDVADYIVTIPTASGLVDVELFDTEAVCDMCSEWGYTVNFYDEIVECVHCEGTNREPPRIGRAYKVEGNQEDVVLSKDERILAVRKGLELRGDVEAATLGDR